MSNKEMEKQLLDEVKLITELSASLQHSCCYDDNERKIVDQLIENSVLRYGLFKSEEKTQREFVKKVDFDKHLIDSKEVAIIMSSKFKTLEKINDMNHIAFFDKWEEDFRIIKNLVKFLLEQVYYHSVFIKKHYPEFEQTAPMEDIFINCMNKIREMKNG